MTTAPIVKTIVYAGQKYIPIKDGSKVHFHFQTWKLGKERVLIDDSKKIGKKEPMVLVIGHKFKLEVWETVVKMMSLEEVASFQVKKELVYSYPFVSKTLRELGQENNRKKHTCTMTLHTEGIGYPDLDDLINNPTDLEFIIEILKIEQSNEYEKELWQLNTDERLKLVPTLKEKGNKFYAQKQYEEAEDAYRQAISICEQLMIRERKTDEEWITLNKLKLPVLLNFAQCKLIKGDFYAVIEHCNTVLEHEPALGRVSPSNINVNTMLKYHAISIIDRKYERDNMIFNMALTLTLLGETRPKDNEKALFRRGKAHVGAWNPDLAEKDFQKLKSINPNMSCTIDKELELIKKLRQDRVEEDRNALKKMFDKENKS